MFKKISAMLSQRVNSARHNKRLIAYTDGINLSGLIVQHCKENNLKVLAAATGERLSAAGLAALLKQLQQQTAEIPERALLLHERMATALLEIPGGDKVQLEAEKVANIVRWEMESHYNEQIAPWKTGTLLQALGFLNTEQRGHLLAVQKEQRHRANNVGGRIQRFGELAIAEGLVKQSELDEALQMLDELQDDSELDCGFQQEKGAATLCAAALSKQERERCIDLFAQADLRLERFYSLAAVLSLIPEQPETVSACLQSPWQILYAEINHKGIEQLEVFNRQDENLAEPGIESLLPKANSSLSNYYWQGATEGVSLRESLACYFAQPPVAISLAVQSESPHIDVTAAEYQPLLAVAFGYFITIQGNMPPFVVGHPPPPPLYLRKNVQLTAACCLLIALLLGFDWYSQQQVNTLQLKLDDLNRKIIRKSQDNRKRKLENKTYARLEKQVTELRTVSDDLQLRKQSIEDNLIERQQFMREFLPLMAASMNPETVLESIAEDNWYVFHVSGWALNQDAIYRFESQLTEVLQPFGMHISKTPSILIEQGELKGAYRFNFELIRQQQNRAGQS